MKRNYFKDQYVAAAVASRVAGRQLDGTPDERFPAPPRTYKIVRNYRSENGDYGRRTVRTGLTLEEAQEHCSDPNTSSVTATSAAAKRITRRMGDWFDGYTEEK